MTNKEFYEFLKREGAYQKYRVNLTKENMQHNCFENTLLKKGYIPIDTAFLWDEVPEGREFWSKIHFKFLSLQDKSN